VTLPVVGGADVPRQSSSIEPAWQRWNDYGIGCYLEGGAGTKKGELRQAEQAFQHLRTLPQKEAHAHAYLNLARVYFDEGRLAEAAQALKQARANDPPAPWWTVAWLTGMVLAQQGHLDEAVASFEQILDPKNQPRSRKFDFTRDYVIINELARALFKRAQQETDPAARDQLLRRAILRYEATLRLDREDLDAHYGLSQCYAQLAEAARLPAALRPAGVVTKEQLQSLARQFADSRLSTAQRLQATAALEEALAAFSDQPPLPTRPKLPVLLGLIETCRAVRAEDKAEGPLSAAAARLLGQLHRRTHQILRPDDNARDRAARLYRELHPAANHAAQSIVIYPLHRAGAPGLGLP
jgi:tetratricopeptide (TPR) repeat protein